MLEAKIIKTGRGPEIAGTRITVYDVIEYYKTGWHRDMIADNLELSSHQVEAAIRYIEEHRDEVMADYERTWSAFAAGTRRSSRRSSTPDTSDSWPWSENGAKPRAGGPGMRGGILADINVAAQRDALLSIWASESWHDVWNGLGLSVLSFRSLPSLRFAGHGNLEDLPKRAGRLGH